MASLKQIHIARELQNWAKERWWEAKIMQTRLEYETDPKNRLFLNQEARRLLQWSKNVSNIGMDLLS